MTEESIDVELLGQSAFHKLTHSFAIRDRLRDVLAEQRAMERQYRRRDNSDEFTSRTAWTEWVLESDLNYTEAALLLGDLIHNLRAALDHAVWAITPVHLQEKRPTEVAFALRSTEPASDAPTPAPAKPATTSSPTTTSTPTTTTGPTNRKTPAQTGAICNR
ncbi:MAG: hypothetical protein WBH51_09655 [Mycolicibacter algericus]|uniref:hypothetical protein n=1 Tax=Mycolicibacter algericus TaxID=1288388 RepID=UPI003C7957C4